MQRTGLRRVRAEACRFRSEKCRKHETIGNIAKKCYTKDSPHHVTCPDSSGDSENQVTDLESERNSEMNGIIATKSAKAGYLVTVNHRRTRNNHAARHWCCCVLHSQANLQNPFHRISPNRN